MIIAQQQDQLLTEKTARRLFLNGQGQNPRLGQDHYKVLQTFLGFAWRRLFRHGSMPTSIFN